MNAVAKEVEKAVETRKITQTIVGWAVNTTKDDEGNTHTVREAVTLERPRIVEGHVKKEAVVIGFDAEFLSVSHGIEIPGPQGVRGPLGPRLLPVD